MNLQSLIKDAICKKYILKIEYVNLQELSHSDNLSLIEIYDELQKISINGIVDCLIYDIDYTNYKLFIIINNKITASVLFIYDLDITFISNTNIDLNKKSIYNNELPSNIIVLILQNHKLMAVKAIKELYDIGLKDAKDILDSFINKYNLDIINIRNKIKIEGTNFLITTFNLNFTDCNEIIEYYNKSN